MDPTGGYEAYDFVSEFYDHVVPYRDRPDVDFYIEMARGSAGPVLELGCGTGRVLIPIARAGVEIAGLDLSSSMLEVCKTKLQTESSEVQNRIELIQGDLRDFHLDRSFPLITIPFRPFQHLLTVQEQLDCLTCALRHLSPGGLLILDLFNPSLPHLVKAEMLEEHTTEPVFSLPDGRIVLRKHRTVARDYFNQINDQELIYEVSYPDGRIERLVHRFKMRYLFRFEVEHLLARVGFRLDTVYADYDRSPYGSTYPGDLIVVASKPD